MAMINVNRENSDPYYRYKMPRLVAKIEGKGNGIKTVVVNMVEIAKSLGRPASYPCKYFGCELGAQTQMDAKNERYIVNGAHDGDRLQDLLDGFIKKFVLCPDCENPETVLVCVKIGCNTLYLYWYLVSCIQHVDRKRAIHQGCQACGYQGTIGPRHKLTTFIQNHPPEGSSSSGKR
jgi:translation initiation factor 5